VASPPQVAAPSANIPYAFSRAHGVLAWRNEGDAVVVLLRPDATIEGIAELKRVLDRPLVTRAVEAETFAAELARAYNQGGAALALREGLANEADLARLMQELPASEDLLDDSAQAPVIRMINALLLQALRERASDLHFEPYEARAVVRFRIDGMLRDIVEPVFNLPGLGAYAVTALGQADLPALLALTLVIAVAVCLLNLCVDLLYAAIDPRVRLV